MIFRIFLFLFFLVVVFVFFRSVCEVSLDLMCLICVVMLI